MATREQVRHAFADGWYEAWSGRAMLGRPCETAADVARRHPIYQTAEVEAHLNGVEDGLRGDRFRLDGEAPVNGCLPFPNTCDWCGATGELQLAPDGGTERLCERCAATVPVACAWTDADECATARERSVAGVSDVIPPCAVHGLVESEAE